MTDIASLLDDLFADLGGDGAPSLPTIPTSLPTPKSLQHTEIVATSHNSHNSHTQSEALSKTYDEKPSNTRVSDADGSRVTSSCVGDVGSVGSVGRGAKTLAGSTLPPFPQDLEDVGSVGRESGACERPLLDLNSAKPQRSDWWTGDLMAEVDYEAPPPGDPLPISPSDVRAGVARELRSLAEDGREESDALRDAVEITKAKIRNSEALAERQANGAACHVCNEPLDDTLPVIAVLSWSRGGALHLHAGCHDVYRTRRTVLVDRIMATAGYGETLTNGEAA